MKTLLPENNRDLILIARLDAMEKLLIDRLGIPREVLADSFTVCFKELLVAVKEQKNISEELK